MPCLVGLRPPDIYRSYDMASPYYTYPYTSFSTLTGTIAGVGAYLLKSRERKNGIQTHHKISIDQIIQRLQENRRDAKARRHDPVYAARVARPAEPE